MAKLRFTKQTVKRVALRLLATLLLFVWIGNLWPPLAALAVDEACQLECCKDLGRHSAGSCAGGACHLAFTKKSESSDLICGANELKKLAEKQTAAQKNIFKAFAAKRNVGVPIFDASEEVDRHGTNNSPLATLQIFRQSCEKVCSVSGSQNSNQQSRADDQERAALSSFADKARPPSLAAAEFSTSVVAKLSQLISRNTPARAPPIS